jgi:hypothetical protein
MSPEFRYLPWDQGRRGEVNGEALAVMASWVVTETGLTRYSLICFFHGRAESLQVSTKSSPRYQFEQVQLNRYTLRSAKCIADDPTSAIGQLPQSLLVGRRAPGEHRGRQIPTTWDRDRPRSMPLPVADYRQRAGDEREVDVRQFDGLSRTA